MIQGAEAHGLVVSDACLMQGRRSASSRYNHFKLLTSSVVDKETVRDLCIRLSAGWTASRDTLQHALLNAVSTALGTQSEVQENIEAFLVARIDLSMVHLRGFSSVTIVVVGPGDHFANLSRVRSSAGNGVLIAVALTATAVQQALAAWRNSYCLVLSASDVIEIASVRNPLNALKDTIRGRYPKRFLMPYSQVGSAEFNMFKGRRAEMEQLLLEDDSSFAVVGPSRIGKTSLLNCYKTRLLKDRDPRALATFYVDLSASRFLSLEAVVPHLALNLDASSRSARLEPHQWDPFVKHLNAKLGQRITLLLDEVDPICGTAVLDMITMTAKRGLCRVVLSGRGGLARLLFDQSRNLAHRYRPLLLGRLEINAAESLLREPLDDMGIPLRSPHRLCRKVLSFSGRLPFHIQFLATQICERVFNSGGNEVTENDIDAVFEMHETSQLFTAPIYELADPVARLIALRVLELGKHPITEATVSELASREDIALNLRLCRRLCEYLVIEHVLVWQPGSYAIANDALIHYSRRQRDGLDRLLNETRLAAHQQVRAEGWAGQ